MVYIVVALCFFAFSFGRVQAQVYDSYIWQYPAPQNITGADDLKLKLENEVQKIINSGHLAPFRAMYGEMDAQPRAHYFWYHRYDTIYTLSLVYPYLNTTLQNSVRSYIQTELQNYPLTSTTLLDPQVGTKREPDSLTTTERYSIDSGYNRRPKLFALYALWLYAQNTGDWTYVQNNWSSITSFYTANRSETSQYYSSIAGAIGFARMARQKTPADSASQTTAISDITTGLNNGKNYATFGANAANIYNSGFPGDWTTWVKPELYLGFHLLDITPEIGRYMFDDATLKSTVIGTQTVFSSSGGAGVAGGIVYDTPSEEYALRRTEYYNPLWYMAQAPAWSRYFAEGSGTAPDLKAMVFPIKAWVQKESSLQLRKYIDVPDALIGDYYYMQNVARVIQASGTECWENITTTSAECSGSVSPTPTPTPTPPPPTPTPPPPAGSNTALQFNPVATASDTTEGVDFGSNIPGLGSVFTVETFFYSTGNNTTYDVILGRQQWGVQDWVISIDTGKAFGSITYDGVHGGTQSVNLTSATTITPNVWHHVALVANGTQFSLYLDGRLEATSTQSGPIFNSGTGTRVFMARKQNSTQSAVFHGSVDEARISNVARYSGSIYTIPTAAFVNDANTLALWHLDDASGTTVVDSSGRGYNGTVSLTPRWITGYTFGTITQPTANKFVVGDRVQTNANLNVRATASPTGTLLGTQTSGALGTVIAGPTVNGGFTWWNINYDTGVDGWSAEDFLNKNTSPTPPPPTPTPTPTPPPPTPAGAPAVSNIVSSASSVGLYNKIEWSFDLSKAYPNPYYYYDASDTPTSNAGTPGANQTWFGVDGVSVDMRLTSPSGRVIVLPAFWMEDYTRIQNGGFEMLGRKNTGKWTVRFTPSEVGTYSYYITAQDKTGTGTSGTGTFTVTSSSNKGFIRTSSIDSRFMTYDNGQPYIPISAGRQWWNSGALRSYDYETAFTQFSQNGINLTRVWQAVDSFLSVEGISPVWVRGDFATFPGAADFIELTAANVHGGLRSARPQNITGKNGYQRIAITQPSVQHKLSVWIKTNALTSAGAVTIRNSTGYNSGTVLGQIATPTGTTGWTQYSVTFTPGSSAASISLVPSTGTGEIYIDDIVFGPVDGSGNITYNIVTDGDFERHFGNGLTGNDPIADNALPRPIGNYFNQSISYEMDKVVEAAQANGVAMQLCSCRSPWGILPVANVDNITDWTAPWVVKSYQRSFRYQLARWGYSPAILSWEFWNEDGHVPVNSNRYSFYQALGSYQAATDPYRHQRTTSQNSQAYSPGLWSSSAMDYSNYHWYLDGHSATLDNDDPMTIYRFAWCLADNVRGTSSPYCNGLGLGDGSTWTGAAKPWVWGEIGVGVDGSVGNTGEAGSRFLHNKTWAGLFSPIGTTPIEWWWYGEDSTATNAKYAGTRAASLFFADVNYDKLNLSYIMTPNDAPPGYTGDTISSTNSTARVYGMRSSDKSKVYMWVQNRGHVWSNVLPQTPVTSTLTIPNLLSATTYNYEIWNTYTGVISSTGSFTTSGTNGSITISNLSDDVAVKLISTVSPTPTPTPPPPTPTPPPPPSTKFTIGQTVQTTANVNVRATANTTGTLLGTQTTGSQGVVTAGPTAQGGFNWWNINYNTGADGWSVEDFLVVAAATPLAGDLNLDHVVNSLDWSIMNSAWFTSNTTADLRVDGQVNSLDFAILSSNWGLTW